jgi:hypothetical protein
VMRSSSGTYVIVNSPATVTGLGKTTDGKL